MWPDDLFNFVLETLAEEITTAKVPNTVNMPCDRWIARSALQKAVRRGDTRIALSALGRLLADDGDAIWRHLAVIALEDIGVAGIDTVARVVAAGRNRKWRGLIGGDWRVASALVSQMAAESHCQATCDLLMRLTNDIAREVSRIDALDRECNDQVAIIRDSGASLLERGEAALALGGGLADDQTSRQAAAVFAALEGIGNSTHVVATAQAAWRLCRNPMALLLPFVWLEWQKVNKVETADDEFLPARMISGVPAYAVDQFTRVGGQVARSLLAQNSDLVGVLDAARVHNMSRAKVVGDLIFLNEGSAVARRAVWPTGDQLRLPHRPLPTAFLLGDRLGEGLALIAAKASQIDDLRRQHLTSACR